MSTETGQLAERAAAKYLEQMGYRVLDRNWRNRWCEIDIVAQKGGEVHFVEVKYRRRSDYGDGFTAITAEKASRLRRAAAIWVGDHRYSGHYSISVIAVTGEPSQWQIELLDNAITGDR